MRFVFISLVFLSVSLFSSSAYAWVGEIDFDEDEIAEHREGISTILSTATACLKNDLDRHQSFFNKYRVSRFYGDRSKFAKMKPAEKLEHIETVLAELNYRSEEIPKLAKFIMSKMEHTSCVGLVLKCLGKGFKAADQDNLWTQIAEYAANNGQDGTAIQNALQKLGWRVIYWNPWTEFNAEWDAREKLKDPENKDRFWGYHEYRFTTVKTKKAYLYNSVDDSTSMVNFGRNVPAFFRRIPFFVGTAHTGYHVFPGMYGNVVEGHSTRKITDGATIESSLFNPMEEGGAPRGNYFSGLVAVPPGY